MKRMIPVIPVILLLAGCGGSETPNSKLTVDACFETSNDAFSCSDMIKDIVKDAQGLAGQLKSDLTQLKTDVDAYCADINTPALQDAAQLQWQTTMANVQQLEVMQFDVIAQKRDEFYIWPSNDTCKTDLQVASNPSGTDDISQVANGRRGLTAVEYILYKDDVTQSCADTYDAVDTWINSTNQTTRQEVRCDYASSIVENLIVQAGDLETSLASLDLEAESDSLQEAANAISNALFYIDKQTKDAKLIAALPQDSNGTFNADVLESQYAFNSKAHIKNNLLAAKNILAGDSGLGLNAYLTAKGQSDLAQEILDAIDNVIENIDAISGDLHTVISSANNVSECINTTTYQSGDSDIVKVCALQKNLKTFTDLLKEDFILALSFSKPSDASGDND